VIREFAERKTINVLQQHAFYVPELVLVGIAGRVLAVDRNSTEKLRNHHSLDIFQFGISSSFI